MLFQLIIWLFFPELNYKYLWMAQGRDTTQKWFFCAVGDAPVVLTQCFSRWLNQVFLGMLLFKIFKINTAWKESTYGVFSGPYFPLFGLKTEIYSVNLRILSEYRKILNQKKLRISTLSTQWHAQSQIKLGIN